MQARLDGPRRNPADFRDIGNGKFVQVMQHYCFSVYGVQTSKARFDRVQYIERLEAVVPVAHLSDLLWRRTAILFAEPIGDRSTDDAVEPRA
jgi:hypothetical protein